MAIVKLARVFSDGAVLQRGKDNKIWGFAEPGDKITVSFAGGSYECMADKTGRFEVTTPAMEKGGPYEIEACSSSGSTKCSDIMIGDVIIISGQSNMEFPMERVRETYPDEWTGPFDEKIRTFKVIENGVFTGPLAELMTGDWKRLGADSIDAFSAVGYFTAKHLRLKEDVTVGLVDLTLGGAPIEAFMSEEDLAGFDEALSEAEKFKDDTYRLGVLSDNEKNAKDWRDDLDRADIGLKEHFEDGEKILREGRDVVLPEFFSDTELDGHIGSVWIARTFSVPAQYAEKPAVLWFGAINDFDWCYINGKLVGSTDYCYPPRRYEVPEGLIREGENTIVFRICIEKGYGRVTPGKLYGLIYGSGVRTTDGYLEGFEGADHIEPLSGVWKYIIGTKCEPSKDTIFVNWKPTALYNGMLAPLSGLSAKAFAFYQGESNCGRNYEYTKLTERFVSRIRRMWGDIPYVCVQLPDFNARMEEISYDGGKAWRGLMKAQEECRNIPGFFLIKSYGWGELNDLHPQRKEPIGKAIADVIAQNA
ncbi:MAG: hypothetical protein J5367_04850 [Lachnospiraceae bacterium]|nr:hypothetical protein [Lachnospiraceae bacterium]